MKLKPIELAPQNHQLRALKAIGNGDPINSRGVMRQVVAHLPPNIEEDSILFFRREEGKLVEYTVAEARIAVTQEINSFPK